MLNRSNFLSVMKRDRKIFKFVWSCIEPFKWKVFSLFFIVSLWAIDVVVRPYILKLLVDKIAMPSEKIAMAELVQLASLYLGLSLFVFVVFRFYHYLWLLIRAPLKRHITGKLMNHMMQHSPAFLQHHFAGNLSNRIKDVVAGVPDFLTLFIDHFYSHFLALIIAIFTFWNINERFAIILSAWLLLFILGSFLLTSRGKKLSSLAAEQKSVIFGEIVDILTNIRNIRLFNTRLFEFKKLDKILQTSVKADQRRDLYFVLIFAFQGFTFVIYHCTCIFVLIYGFKNGTVTPGDFALIVSVNNTIIDCLWTLSDDIGKFADLTGNIKQGLRIALTPFSIQEKIGAQDLKITDGKIEFENVSFGFPGNSILFKDLSLVIPGKQKIGLVGYSGSGKSTFINLILRFYDPQVGAVLLDGCNVKDCTKDSIYSNISMVAQEAALFHRDIMENIRYGNVAAGDAEVIEVSKKVYIDDFISELNDGYHALVGERGSNISGGQRQLISVGRAMLRDTPILLLDEATSALDSITESKIQKSLETLMQNKTTIVVAHRLSTILKLDRILVFDRGKIVQDGIHEELVKQEGLYKKMWEAQIGGFLPDKATL